MAVRRRSRPKTRVKARRAPVRSTGRRRNWPKAAGASREDADELVLYIENDYALVKRAEGSFVPNLAKKMAKGTYDIKLAAKLWTYLATEGAAKYEKEFGKGGPGRNHDFVFTVATRKLAAEDLERNYRDFVKEEAPKYAPKGRAKRKVVRHAKKSARKRRTSVGTRRNPRTAKRYVVKVAHNAFDGSPYYRVVDVSVGGYGHVISVFDKKAHAVKVAAESNALMARPNPRTRLDTVAIREDMSNFLDGVQKDTHLHILRSRQEGRAAIHGAYKYIVRELAQQHGTTESQIRKVTAGMSTAFADSWSEANAPKRAKRRNAGRKPSKYVDLYVVQGNYGYGHGWEDVSASQTRAEARADLKAYHANSPGSHRLITRKVLRSTGESAVRKNRSRR